MAITSNSFEVTLADGSGNSTYVVNDHVVTMEEVDGVTVLELTVNGENLRVIESDNDITTPVTGLLALAGNFITISTENGDIYRNAGRIVNVEVVDGSNSIVWYNPNFGEFIKKIEATESASSVNSKIQAL